MSNRRTTPQNDDGRSEEHPPQPPQTAPGRRLGRPTKAPPPELVVPTPRCRECRTPPPSWVGGPQKSLPQKTIFTPPSAPSNRRGAPEKAPAATPTDIAP